MLSKASSHDINYPQILINKAKKKGIKFRRIGCDKGYDDTNLRMNMINSNIIPVIPYRKNVKIKNYENEYIKHRKYCRQRWKVERGFAWKDNSNRRIEHFYEKSLPAYDRLYTISVIRFFLKRLRFYIK